MAASLRGSRGGAIQIDMKEDSLGIEPVVISRSRRAQWESVLAPGEYTQYEKITGMLLWLVTQMSGDKSSHTSSR